jgi:hypothetical protein
MAVYKLFPSKDTTLYSYYPLMNTGLDAICEVSNTLDPIMRGEVPMVARYLMQFDTDEIKDVINSKIGTKSYDVFLRNFIATARGMNQDTQIEFHPLAQAWNNGTGHYLDNPDVDNGASWAYSNFSGSGIWDLSGSLNGWDYTGSWTGSNENAEDAVGGGNWIFDTGSNQYAIHGYMSPSYVQGSSLNLPVTQSFGLRSVKDIEINVNDTIDVWYNEAIPNYGFIAKLTGSDEFNKSKYIQPILKYYSVDTNTIYPPQLEFRWRDYTTVINSSTTNIIDTVNLKLSLSENPGEFNQDAVNRFYINLSPLYPARVYQTASLYTELHYLPTSSYYAVKDLETNEFVINFDTQYTQISSDSDGNYFDIYMNGLEPERYYAILIKTTIDSSTLILDEDYYFKVING